MVDSRRSFSAVGTVLNDKMVCQTIQKVTSSGIWYGDDPLDYSSPVLMAQLILIFFLTRTTYLLLRPLRQSMVIAQIIAGIIIGPSFLARYKVNAAKLFPPGGILILETFADFGIMIHLFVLGVQVDASLLKSTGRKAMVIGLSGTIFSLALSGTAYTIVQKMTPLDTKLGIQLPLIVAINSMTFFVVTTRLLAELNILNSELGRLASSTSLVSDACGWVMTAVITNLGLAIRYSTVKPILTILSMLSFYSTLLFILRPLVIRIVRHTPEGKPMKESHFLAILVIVLGAGFCGEFIGQHAGFSAFMFGLSLPDGPALGSVLVQKLDTFASQFLFPVYCAISGLRTDLSSLVERRSSLIVVIVIMVGYIGKFTGTLLPSLCFDIPFSDALSLALIMCCRGFMEIAVFRMWSDNKVISNQVFTCLIISMVIITGIATPIVSYLYDPSKRYMAYQRRTILHSKQDLNLRILVCIHSEDNVPPIINLIEASNPIRSNPLSISVLQLMELTGRAAAILAPHHLRNKPTSKMTRSEHIVNAFKYFEQYSQGNVMVKHFTAVAPYASMHDDICTLAVDKMISIVILPYHKQWAIDGTVEASSPSIRAVNKNVINKAPCSVGVLVDRGQIRANQTVLMCQSLYRIAMLFIGGADDEEALAYSRRMAEHPNISLMVVWLKPWGGHETYRNDRNNLDSELIMNDFRANAVSNKKIAYKEEIVKDGLGTTRVIRSMMDDFDLFIVGKHHEPNSPVTLGFTEWSECPELGIIGDMLATSNFPFSVLVVQQPLGAGFLDSAKDPMAPSRDKNSMVYHDLYEDEYDNQIHKTSL